MPICRSFAAVLAAGRAQFNQRVTEARRRFPAFDTEAFADFLHNGVDPVVQATADVAPERVASTVLVAYDMALELVGLVLAGPRARSPLVNRTWQKLAPSHARLVAEHPADVLGMLSNAAINIGKVASARPEQWLHDMALLAPRVQDLRQLQATGQLLAWRAGMAHFRLGAIQAADTLPEALALAAMGVEDSARWTTVRDGLLANPWWTPNHVRPDANVEPGMEIGKFTGFGGEFAEPPEVRPCPEGFFVRSGSRYSFLIADAFGAVLHTASAEEFEHAASHRFPQAARLNGTRLLAGQRDIELELPAGHIAITCNQHTVAVSSPFTHAIRLVPLQ